MNATPVVAMPFGRHKDKPFGAVPSSYLLWVLSECKLSSGLRSAVAAELARRGIDAPPPPAPKPIPPCTRCGAVGRVCRWQTWRDGRRMIGAECQKCGGLLRHVAQTPANIALANENA